jgi:hypothetical protein
MFSRAQESAYSQAALAENAFARLNYEALIGDGRKATFDTKLAQVLTPEAYKAVSVRLAQAGVQTRPQTYGDVFNAAVYFVAGNAHIDYDLLLAAGVLSPRVTAEQLRDVLRFGEGPRAARERRVPGTSVATTATPCARPLGWTTMGAPAATTSDGQPVKSGWYLRVRLAWPDHKLTPTPLGSHSAFGYYDAQTKRWGLTSSLDYEYDPEFVPTPGIGGEMALESNVHKLTFYPVTMGPAAGGLTTEQFNQAMKHDVMSFEAHYRTLSKVGSPDRKIFYQFIPSWSSARIDGNCNTYASYLLKSLGVREPYPHGEGRVGTAGNEVIARNADGDVIIYGDGDAAKANKLIGATAPAFGWRDALSSGIEHMTIIARYATSRRP